jgi:hypothetical protein
VSRHGRVVLRRRNYEGVAEFELPAEFDRASGVAVAIVIVTVERRCVEVAHRRTVHVAPVRFEDVRRQSREARVERRGSQGRGENKKADLCPFSNLDTHRGPFPWL